MGGGLWPTGGAKGGGDMIGQRVGQEGGGEGGSWGSSSKGRGGSVGRPKVCSKIPCRWMSPSWSNRAAASGTDRGPSQLRCATYQPSLLAGTMGCAPPSL